MTSFSKGDKKLTPQEQGAKLETAADEFAATLKRNFKVREVIYLVAFDNPDTGEVQLAHGSTESVPESVRAIMLNEALNARK